MYSVKFLMDYARFTFRILFS